MEKTPPPFAQVLQLILGKWVSGAVCALAKLGVPDHIDDKPRSAEEVAAKIGAKPELLYRLMRATAGLGVLSETPDHKFVQTPLSAALRTDAVPCVRNMAMFNSDEWHMRGWGQLAETVMTGERPVERIYGMPAFEYLNANPAAGQNFHRGMTDMSTVEGPPVADAYDFSGIKTITDVAGGYGLLLALIGGVVGVYLAGGVLSLASMIGFITLFGIATRNGIMLVSHIQHLIAAEGITDFRQAVERGARERLIPILMTALAAALALVPLALGGDKSGSEIQTPMAIVILCGLLSSTLLNMVVVPTLYLRFCRPPR